MCKLKVMMLRLCETERVSLPLNPYFLIQKTHRLYFSSFQLQRGEWEASCNINIFPYNLFWALSSDYFCKYRQKLSWQLRVMTICWPKTGLMGHTNWETMLSDYIRAYQLDDINHCMDEHARFDIYYPLYLLILGDTLVI